MIINFDTQFINHLLSFELNEFLFNENLSQISTVLREYPKIKIDGIERDSLELLRLLADKPLNNELIGKNLQKNDILANLKSNPFCFNFLENEDNYIILEQEGYFVINSKKIQNLKNLLDSHTFSISINEHFKAWNDFQKYIIKSNFLIISDLYFLKNESKLNENLFKIMDLFFEKGKNDVLELLIITDELYNDNLDNVYSKIKGSLNKISTKNKLTLIKINKSSKKYAHDRYIITPYQFIHSGHGLDYFDGGKIDNNTTISIKPFLKKDEFETAIKKMKDFFNVIKNAERNNFKKEYCGKKNNKLTDIANNYEF